MARGKRKFVLELDQTCGITVGIITAALQRTASVIGRGTGSIESGSVLDGYGYAIGRYYWEDQEPTHEGRNGVVLKPEGHVCPDPAYGPCPVPECNTRSIS